MNCLEIPWYIRKVLVNTVFKFHVQDKFNRAKFMEEKRLYKLVTVTEDDTLLILTLEQ